LERRRLVVRKNHASDRRIRVVELTARGRKLIEKAYLKHKIDMEKAVVRLNPHERSLLVNLLKRLGGVDGNLSE
jgi:MarR family transcriptional regulator, 2-MHQ and catechol-resistance regulon repressor